MPVARFRVVPDIQPGNKIDSSIISKSLQKQGIDCEVRVDHAQGIVEIFDGPEMAPADPERKFLSPADLSKVRETIRAHPSFIEEIS